MRRKRLSISDIADMLRELGLLLGAKISVQEALDIVGAEEDRRGMQALINSLQQDLKEENALADALARHARQLPPFLTDFIRDRERQNRLDSTLIETADYLDSIYITGDHHRSILRAFYYPLTVLLIASAVCFVLMVFVVPQFEDLFSGFGVDLPALTVVVVDLARLLGSLWWLLPVAGLLLLFGLTPIGRPHAARCGSWLIAFLPGWAAIQRNIDVVRLLRTVALLRGQEDSPSVAVAAAGMLARNPFMAKALSQIHADLLSGTEFANSLQASRIVPRKVVRAALVGTRSQNLAAVFARLADTYSRRIDARVSRSSQLVAPWLTVIVGVFLGLFLIAMYLPIFKMGWVI